MGPIQVSARLTIHPGRLEKFKSGAADKLLDATADIKTRVFSTLPTM